MKKIKGLVRVKIIGIDAAEFIDLCMKKGIALAEVKIETEAVLATVGSHEAKELLYIVRQKHGKAKIVAKTGLGFKMRKNKHYRGVSVGLIVVLAVLYLVSGYIWSYDISGNEQYSEAEIIAILEQYNLSLGRKKEKLDLDAITREILDHHTQEIAWIWLGTKGTVLEVKIKELERPLVDYNYQADIIAAKDGVVREVLVLEGSAVIKAGDTVKKGEILIKGVEYDNWMKDTSGVYVPADNGRMIRAKGTVTGLTKYELSEATGLSEHKLIARQKEQSSYYLYQNDREIWHSKGAKIALEKVIWQKNWQIAQNNWCVIACESIEQDLVKKNYDLKEAYNLSIERLKKVKSHFDENNIYDFKQSLGESEQADIVMVQAQLIYSEDLGELVYYEEK